MSKVLTSLPVGERVGIAFSGGLDTSVRRRLDARQGRRALHLHGRPRAVRRARHRLGARPRAVEYGAEIARLVDCTEALVEEGLSAIACGAFHIRSGGKTYFNTTPLGRVVTGTLLVRAMQDDERLDLGRRLDLQGQRHRAVLPLRPARQPGAADLQAVARRGLRRRARRPARDVGVARRARPALPRLDREGLLAPTPTCWGATHEAKTPRAPRRRPWRSSSRSWASSTGTRRSRSRPRTSPSRFEQGRPVAINGTGRSRRRRRSSTRPTPSAAATGSACPTRSRTGSSRRRAAASTRRPAWRCCSPPTSASSTRSTTRTPSPTTTRRAAASAACSTRAAGSTRSR